MDNFDKAGNYYDENKETLLAEMMGWDIDVEEFPEEDQVVVTVGGVIICYQNGDMNGDWKGTAVWGNSGADSHVDDFIEKFKESDKFSKIIAYDETHENHFAEELINDLCSSLCDEHELDSYFEEQ